MKMNYNYRVTLGFIFITLMFLIMSAGSIFQYMRKSAIACCSAKICATERHHEYIK